MIELDVVPDSPQAETADPLAGKLHLSFVDLANALGLDFVACGELLLKNLRRKRP